jgi:TRAP-type mannitol/chloroaromatic compound transport system permease small subunit
MIGFALLAMQGVSELIKRIAIMRGIIPDPHETQRSALEAEVEHLIEGTEKR